MGALSWLSEWVQALALVLPRRIIVRATHAGVKWTWGRRPKALSPGVHIYWPLVTEIELIVAARQTDNLPTQIVLTKDRQAVAVGTALTYRIRDVLRAIGAKNWDVSQTISDVAQAAVAAVIARTALAELPGDCEDALTRECRRLLRRYGVSVARCSLTDFAPCKVFRLIQ